MQKCDSLIRLQFDFGGRVLGTIEISTSGKTLPGNMFRPLVRLVYDEERTVADGKAIVIINLEESVHKNYLLLHASGYNQKLHKIVETFAESLKTLADDVTEQLFQVFVEQCLKNVESCFLCSTLLNMIMLGCIVDTCFILPQLQFRAMKTITFGDFKEFCTRYLQEIRIKAVMQGNLDASRAQQIMSDILKVLDCVKVQNVSTSV